MGEGELEDAASVRRLQYDFSLEELGIPDVDRRTNVDLS